MKSKSTLSLNDSKQKKQRKFLFLVIFATAFLLYANSIGNEYAMDDNYVTVTTPEQPNNPRIEKGIKGLPEIFTTHYIETSQQSFEYRPIPLATFAIEYQFFGSNPHISHFVNIVLYALTCVLLLSVLLTLFKGHGIVFPLLTTIIFMVHPIHTEVVNNLKCRDELLSFLFGLLSFYFFLKSANSEKHVPLFNSLLFLLLALFCKRTAILFVFLMPLSAYLFAGFKLKKIFISVFLFLAIYTCFGFFQIAVLSSSTEIREFAFFENPLFYDDGFLKRLALSIYTYGYYLKLLLIPYPLACYYGYNAIPMRGFDSFEIWLSLIVHLVILILAIKNFKTNKIIFYAVCIYLIGIFPFSNFMRPVVGIIGERFIYFASLGFCIGIAYALMLLSKINLKNTVIGIKELKPSFVRNVCVLVFVFSTMIIFRNSKWKDHLALFSNDVKHFENSYFLNYFLATTLNNEGSKMEPSNKRNFMLSESRRYFAQSAKLLRKGLEIYKTDYYTMSSVGTVYVNYLNNVDSAIPYFKKALSIDPNYEIARYNLNFCYEKKNLKDSAQLLYERMVNANTKYLPVFYRLHELYLQKSNYVSAIKLDLKALEISPRDVKLHVNLGNAYILDQDTLNSIKYFEEAVNLAPADYKLLRSFINVLKQTGNQSKSIKYEERAAVLEKKLKN